MSHTFYPDPQHFTWPLIVQNRRGMSRDVIMIPVIKWLINNVGELAEFRDDEWPHGNGWETGYASSKDAVSWERRHYIIIRRLDIDERLLTEFALRFL